MTLSAHGYTCTGGGFTQWNCGGLGGHSESSPEFAVKMGPTHLSWLTLG
jgi:hypothetical protein